MDGVEVAGKGCCSVLSLELDQLALPFFHCIFFLCLCVCGSTAWLGGKMIPRYAACEMGSDQIAKTFSFIMYRRVSFLCEYYRLRLMKNVYLKLLILLISTISLRTDTRRCNKVYADAIT